MSPRKKLGKGYYGKRGKGVSIWIEGHLIRAQWRHGAARKKQSWPNTKENRAYVKTWAETFAAERLRPRAAIHPITTRELWASYVEAEFGTLRPRSQSLYTEYWRRWVVFVTPQSIAEDLGVLTVGEFRADLDRRGLAINTMRKAVEVVKVVYAWGKRSKLLNENEVRDYVFKVPKDRRPVQVPEFRNEEFVAILEQLPLEGTTTWRAGAAIALCGYQGARANAVLHLRWEDVDLTARTMTWRAAWDKMGIERVQPLRAPTIAVLEAIRERSTEAGSTGWVFPSATRKSRHETYTVQSLVEALHRAERAAGITPIPGRGVHGFRRMLFNNVLAVEGDISSAMSAIGDRDMRVASGYRRDRDDQLREQFDRMDGRGETAGAPKEHPVETKGNMPTGKVR